MRGSTVLGPGFFVKLQATLNHRHKCLLGSDLRHSIPYSQLREPRGTARAAASAARSRVHRECTTIALPPSQMPPSPRRPA